MQQQKRRAPRWLIFMLGAFIAVSWVCGGLLGQAQRDLPVGDAVAKQAVSDAEKAGLALSYKELDPVPFPSDAQNAGPLIVAMGKSLTSLERGWSQNDRALFSLAAKGTIQDATELQTLLSQTDASLIGEPAALAMPTCAVKNDKNASTADLESAFEALGDVAACKGFLALSLGKTGVAIDQMKVLNQAAQLAALSNTAAEEAPALSNRAIALIQSATEAPAVDKATLTQLLAVAEAIPAPPAASVCFRQWLARELSYYDDCFVGCQLPSSQGSFRQELFHDQCTLTNTSNLKVLFGALKTRMIRASLPVFADLQTAKTYEEDEAALVKPLQGLNGNTDWVAQLISSRMYDQTVEWRALLNQIDSFRTTLANQRVAVCSLWVKLYKLEHGLPPKTLGAELGDFAVDPFGNQAMGYDGVGKVWDHFSSMLNPTPMTDASQDP
jgi:hypothetical protein